MELLQQTYFSDILHAIAQAVLLPVVVALIALTLYAVWSVGRIVVEWFTENRHFRVKMPAFLDVIIDAETPDLPYVVAGSGLLGSQKRILLSLWDYRNLPVDTHIALAKRLIEEREDYHAKMLQHTSVVSKIEPMLGLMGTLIPLGPGLVSLGQGDTTALSTSLLVAFDTTVAGLIVALLTFVVTKIRQRWYRNYMSALEACCTCLLEKVDAQREAGTLGVTQATHCLEELQGNLKSGVQNMDGASSRKDARGQKRTESAAGQNDAEGNASAQGSAEAARAKNGGNDGGRWS